MGEAVGAPGGNGRNAPIEVASVEVHLIYFLGGAKNVFLIFPAAFNMLQSKLMYRPRFHWTRVGGTLPQTPDLKRRKAPQ